MKERPILFSGAMCRAILAGAKTQTRRVVTASNSLVNGSAPCMKPDPSILGAWCSLDFSDAFVDRGPSPAGNPGPYLQVAGGDRSRHRVYARTQPGDRLWVRETFAPRYFDGGKPGYRADWDGKSADLVPEPRWKPSIFMRRHESRITLEVTGVRVERLQDISEEDALAEGISGPHNVGYPAFRVPEDSKPRYSSAKAAFEALWDSINSKRSGCSWEASPWVWVVSFRRLT